MSSNRKPYLLLHGFENLPTSVFPAHLRARVFLSIDEVDEGQFDECVCV